MPKLQAITFAGFPRGVSDLGSDYALPEGACRSATNVLFQDSGRFDRRPGFSLVASGGDSLWSNGELTLYRLGTDLVRLNADFTTTVLTSGCTHRIEYLSFASDVYFCSGGKTGIIRDGAYLPWGLPQYQNRRLILTPTATGDMDAGVYQVACTYVSASGEESGTSSTASVEVEEGGGFLIEAIEQVSNAAYVNVYVSTANVSTPYLFTQVVVSTPSVWVGRYISDVMLETAGGRPPPPGGPLEHHKGRIWIADGNVVWCTEPLRYGLYKPATGYRVFQHEVLALAAVSEGMYIGTDREIYYRFNIGTDQEQQITVSHYGVLPGRNKIKLNGDGVAILTQQGWALAAPQASIKNVQKDLLAPITAKHASTILWSWKGQQHLLATLLPIDAGDVGAVNPSDIYFSTGAGLTDGTSTAVFEGATQNDLVGVGSSTAVAEAVGVRIFLGLGETVGSALSQAEVLGVSEYLLNAVGETTAASTEEFVGLTLSADEATADAVGTTVLDGVFEATGEMVAASDSTSTADAGGDFFILENAASVMLSFSLTPADAVGESDSEAGGSVVCVATTAGVGIAIVDMVVDVTGVAEASATGTSLTLALSEAVIQSAGLSTATGAGGATKSMAASSTGTGVASGVLAATTARVGAATATSTAAFTGTSISISITSAVAASLAQASVAAASELKATRSGAAASTGVATMSAAAIRIVGSVMAGTGTTTLTAVGTGFGSTQDGVMDGDGLGTVTGRITGIFSAVGTV